MSKRHVRIPRAREQVEPVRRLEKKPAMQHEQLLVQGVAPQVAYRGAPIKRIGLRATDLLAIHRTVGNWRVQRMLAERRSTANENGVLQRDRSTRSLALPTPAALAATPARRMSPMGSADLTRLQRILIANDQIGAVRFIAQIMERRSEIDAALMGTRAVSGHVQSECHSTDAYVLDSTANGANTISCGCFTEMGRRLPNPRVRINFGSFQTMALTTPHQNQYQEHLAELLHSTLRHEFRHVLQDNAACNAMGAHRRDICTFGQLHYLSDYYNFREFCSTRNRLSQGHHHVMGQEPAKDDLQTRQRSQGSQIDLLASWFGWIIRSGTHSCSEVLDSRDLVVPQQQLAHMVHIEPFVGRVLHRTVVQVEAVDVYPGFHCNSLAQQAETVLGEYGLAACPRRGRGVDSHIIGELSH
jgi:hypothetical protein